MGLAPPEPADNTISIPIDLPDIQGDVIDNWTAVHAISGFVIGLVLGRKQWAWSLPISIGFEIAENQPIITKAFRIQGRETMTNVGSDIGVFVLFAYLGSRLR